MEEVMTEEEKLAKETFDSVHPSDEYVRGQLDAYRSFTDRLLNAMVALCDRSQ